MPVFPIFVIAMVVLYCWTKELFPNLPIFPKPPPPKPDTHEKLGKALAEYLRERAK
jgi:hypothetical protein